MKLLGVYFGSEAVSLVETEGRRVTNSINIPFENVDSDAIEEKVTDEIKLLTLIKGGLSKSIIEAKTAHIVIPGKDLIIRTFNMPVMPAQDLNNAVKYEVRKYIPFKIEELTSDFVVIYDRDIQKNLVLFVGVKKDVLDKYVRILKQLNIQPVSAEYAGFGFLRLLQLAGFRDNDVVAVVNFDANIQDEINFIVLDKGFPLFNRDILLAEPSSEEGGLQAGSMALNEKIEKVKIELRISWDFYLRKFPTKNIKKIIFVAPEQFRTDMDIFAKERSVSAEFMNIAPVIVNRPANFSLGLYKAYSATLIKSSNAKLKVDLMSAGKAKSVHLGGMPILQAVNINPKFVALGLLLCLGMWGIGVYRVTPFKKQKQSIIDSRPEAYVISGDATLDEITAKSQELNQKLKSINDMVKRRLMLTARLDAIPRIIPEGVWLKDFSFKESAGSYELVLEGYAYLKDSAKEVEAVTTFSTALKNNPAFNAKFPQVENRSMNQEELEKQQVTSFTIVCKGAVK